MLVIDLRPALVADLPARVGGRMTEASDPTMRDASARHTKRAERNVIMVAVVLRFKFMTCCSVACRRCPIFQNWYVIWKVRKTTVALLLSPYM